MLSRIVTNKIKKAAVAIALKLTLASLLQGVGSLTPEIGSNCSPPLSLVSEMYVSATLSLSATPAL